MARELTQEGVNMGETRGRDCATAGVRAEAIDGGVEGVWMQRAAGKSDCGEWWWWVVSTAVDVMS